MFSGFNGSHAIFAAPRPAGGPFLRRTHELAGHRSDRISQRRADLQRDCLVVAVPGETTLYVTDGRGVPAAPEGGF